MKRLIKLITFPIKRWKKMENKNKDGKTIIEEVDYAGEVQNLVTTNEDISFLDDSLFKTIFDANKDELLKVVKSVGSKIQIISVEKFNEEFLSKNF